MNFYKKNKPGIIEIDGKLIKSTLIEELFACDIAQCKGACCVEGDLGAPLETAEVDILRDIYPKVKPFLNKKGKKAIEEQGTSVIDFTKNQSTPLVNGRECAYAIFKDGIALCGIEQAYEAGEVDFKKPISCHLYPIRTHTYRGMESLNYDRWNICSPACALGKEEGVKVYEFVKEAIIRKYGVEFYEALDEVAKNMETDDRD